MARLAKKKGRPQQKRFQKKLHPTSQNLFRKTKRLATELSKQEDLQKQALQDWVQAEQIVKEQLRRVDQGEEETTS